MSIAEMQACLARLYVSEPFRNWFYADPDLALASYSLAEEERDALRGLDRSALDLFAASLITKRRKRIERTYPALFALDAAAMRRCYIRFYHLFPARLDHASVQDVVDFGKFVEETFARGGQVPPYTSDLARYERLYYLAAVAGDIAGEATLDADATPPQVTPALRPARRRAVQVADFAYDVGDIEEALRHGQAPGEVPPPDSACTIVFCPSAGPSGVRMLRINTPTKIVLGLCDGTRSVAEIVVATEMAVGAADLNDAVVDTIGRLLASRVLGTDVDEDVHDPAALQRYSAAVQNESM
jgi:hypothetical protein